MATALIVLLLLILLTVIVTGSVRLIRQRVEDAKTAALLREQALLQSARACNRCK